MAEATAIPITKADLVKWVNAFGPYLAEVQWEDPKKIGAPNENAATAAANRLLRYKTIGGSGSSSYASKIALIGLAQKLSGNNNLLDDDTNHVLNVIQTGMALGSYVSDQYRKSSGMIKLEGKAADSGGPTAEEKQELEAKRRTYAHILLFVTANYITWKLGQYKEDEIGALVMSLDENPPIVNTNGTSAVNSSLYYFGSFVADSNKVHDSVAFVKAALVYYERVLNVIGAEVETLQYKDFFTTKRYVYEEEEFVMNGFEETRKSSGGGKIQVRNIRMTDIVANREARKSAMRTIDRLLCYDIDEQKNPWHELGGLPGFNMYFGPPGTGKSMQIAATYNYGLDRANEIGIPFLMHPLPKTLISSLQGDTAVRVEQYFRKLRNPKVITYAPWDDCENLLGDRARQGASEGQGHIISSVLTETEGANAVNLGNFVIQIMTNLPEVLDAAILSRVQSRVLLGGPQSYEDFIALDYLWYTLHVKQVPDILGKNLPRKEDYQASLDIPKFLSEIKFDQELVRPEIKEILHEAEKKHSRDDVKFFAHFQHLMSKKFSYWTARESRNVQASVDFILMDFDIPDEFFTNRSVFFEKTYAERLGILTELKKKRAQEVDLKKIWLQELLKHSSSLVTIKSSDLDRQVESRTQQMIVEMLSRKKALESRPELFG